MARGARLTFIALVVALSAGVPREAQACQCGVSPDLCETFARTCVVFTGEVLAITGELPTKPPAPGQPPPRRRVTLRVERAFRGAPAERVEVYTGFGDGDCGYPFKRGDKYLVFANERDGQLYTSVCSWTRPLADALEQVEEIARSCVNQPPLLLVRGSVVRQNSRAAGAVMVMVYSAMREDGKTTERPGELLATPISDRRGNFSVRLPATRRYFLVVMIGDERGDVGPFELTPATAPVLIVLRKKP